jgi:hypothetical protein
MPSLISDFPVMCVECKNLLMRGAYFTSRGFMCHECYKTFKKNKGE